MELKIDVLAIASHPDDVELGCAGTLLKMKALGHAIGVIDLTRGELGTRGTPEIRAAEAAAAAKVLGLAARENLQLRDGFFRSDEYSLLEVIRVLRQYKPAVVLTNAPTDRHPDHGRGAALVKEACFLSGLRRISTQQAGKEQDAWRPTTVLNFIQDHYLLPTLVVDISPYLEQKMEAVRCYRSQFFDPQSTEPETRISTKYFLDAVAARAQEMGHAIGVAYGEGFICEEPLKANDLIGLR